MPNKIQWFKNTDITKMQGNFQNVVDLAAKLSGKTEEGTVRSSMAQIQQTTLHP